VKVQGCGEVANHTLIPWECGNNESCPICPEGTTCINHTCVFGDLTGPESLFIGENADVEATEGGEPCRNCEIIVITPTSKTITGRTDENGKLDFPLEEEGAYQVALLRNGTVIKSIMVNALPKPSPVDEAKPTTEATDAGPIFLIILVIVAIIVIIYLRRGKKRKK